MTKAVLDRTIELVKDILKSLLALCQGDQAEMSQVLAKLEEAKASIDQYKMEELAGLSSELKQIHQYFTEEENRDKVKLMFARLVSSTCFMLEEASLSIANLESRENRKKVAFRFTDLELE